MERVKGIEALHRVGQAVSCRLIIIHNPAYHHVFEEDRLSLF